MMDSIRALYGPYYGARILDRYVPGWWKRIDLGTLDLWDIKQCIAGQLFNGREDHYSGYDWAMCRVPMNDGRVSTITQMERLGFEASQPDVDLFEVEMMWREIIVERRQNESESVI